MKKKAKYLKFYMDCLKTGLLPDVGLCACEEIDDDMIDLFKPRDGFCLSYWGYNGDPHFFTFNYFERREFTAFRQTIVLLMAAMNNEL